MMFDTSSSSTRFTDITFSSERPASAPKRSATSPIRLISLRWLTKVTVTLDIQPAQHAGRRLVEQVGAADVFEPLEQIVGAQALLLGAAEVVEHRPPVHHDEPVAEVRGLRHR